MNHAGLKQRVHQRFLDELDPRGAPQGGTQLERRLSKLLIAEAPLLDNSNRDRILDELTREVTGLGPLEPLLADPDVSEVMVNAGRRVYVERNGQVVPVAVDIDAATLVRLVERVVAPLGLRLDRASPIVDARLADGSRLHAVIPPLAVDGPCLTIRRFRTQPVVLEEFSLSLKAATFLRNAVRRASNIVVAGGTSAGKTTLLNALSGEVPAIERVVTIEETAELRLVQPHVVRLEARPANSEGAGAVTLRDLVRTALRMRPDRLVIGEVRGAEALDMLQAFNTGHDGGLSTVHANTAADAVRRLETLVLLAAPIPLPAVRSQLGAAIDIVVHVAREGRGRVVREIVELGSSTRPQDLHVLFRRDGDELVACGAPRRPARRRQPC